MSDKPPLEDPFYEPEHRPEYGKIPEVVIHFGQATQLRWFKRFLRELSSANDFSEYYVSSKWHKGLCCGSCEGEYEDNYMSGGIIADGNCCCQDRRLDKLLDRG